MTIKLNVIGDITPQPKVVPGQVRSSSDGSYIGIVTHSDGEFPYDFFFLVDDVEGSESENSNQYRLNYGHIGGCSAETVDTDFPIVLDTEINVRGSK